MAMIKIGEIIREQLRDQGKTVVWFARQLSCSRNNVYKIFHSYSISTQELLRISKILNYDFFAVYSDDLCQWQSSQQHPECNQSVDM